MLKFIKKCIIRNQKKRESISAPAEKDNVQHIDYEKITSAIVSANKILQSEAEAQKLKVHKTDSLSMSLVDMLRLTFGILIGFLTLFTVLITGYSFVNCYATWKTSLLFWLVLVCWAFYYYGAITILVSVVNPASKRCKITVYSASFCLFASILFALALYVLPCINLPTLLASMLIATFALILIGFLFIITRAVKNETDRNFLVSYFSAIMATAAFVATIVFSLLQLSHK